MKVNAVPAHPRESFMKTAPLILATLFAVAASTAFAAEGEGLTTSPRWQCRVLLGTGSSLNALGNAAPTSDKWVGSTAANGGLTVRSLSVLGDYYFGNRVAQRASLGGSAGASGDTLSGGFRATSGVLLGQRSGAYPLLNLASPARNFNVDLRSAYAPPSEPAPAEANAVPYVGVGYTGASTKGRWGFSADVGVMALNPGSAVKLGRVVGGGQNLDDVLREMRVSPMLQLGVSYSF
jgi:hypothetical protein